jgi:hypothetical protein
MRIARFVIGLVGLTGAGCSSSQQAAKVEGAEATALTVSTSAPALAIEPPPAEEIYHARPPLSGPKRDLEFKSLPVRFPSGRAQLANGEVIVDVVNWQTVAVADLADGETCTAALIGPRVILTAAHCVDAEDRQNPRRTIGGSVRFVSGAHDIVSCEMHDRYAAADLPAERVPRSSEDWALCELDSGPAIVIETLAISPAAARNEPILMMGYGCIDIYVFANRLSWNSGGGLLRQGDGVIEAVGVGNASTAAGSYVRTRAPGREPILCPGDSGGPAFRNATVANPGVQGRRVVAVNSRVTAIPQGGSYTFYSFLSAVTAPSFSSWLGRWRGDNRWRRVCGLGPKPETGTCRT